MKKYRITIYLIFIFLIICNIPTNGQLSRDFPYALNPGREILLMVPGTLLMHGSALGQNHKEAMDIEQISLLDPANINFIDRFATSLYQPDLNTWRENLEPASVILSGALIGSLGLYYRFTTFEWQPLMTLGLMYLEGGYLSTGTMLAAKVIFNRPRPYTYNQSLTLESRVRGANNESFFSGNATLLFFHAVFISKVLDDIFENQQWTRWVWLSTLGIASLSGYWSVRSGMHFPTDVLTGAAIGAAFGYLIPTLHKTKIQGLAVTPWIHKYGKGISLCKAF